MKPPTWAPATPSMACQRKWKVEKDFAWFEIFRPTPCYGRKSRNGASRRTGVPVPATVIGIVAVGAVIRPGRGDPRRGRTPRRGTTPWPVPPRSPTMTAGAWRATPRSAPASPRPPPPPAGSPSETGRAMLSNGPYGKTLSLKAISFQSRSLSPKFFSESDQVYFQGLASRLVEATIDV